LAGQQVNGTGIPVGTTVLASPPPTATAFTMSQAATAAGSTALTIGAEPLTLAEAKQWARIQYAVDDNIVAKLIAKARRLGEGPLLKRAFMLQSKCLYFMGFPWSGYYSLAIRGMGLNPWWFPYAQGIIQLPYPTLQAVTSVQYVDTTGTLQTIPPANYVYTPNAQPGRLQPAYGLIWPVARPQVDAVQITFTCGYGALESDVPESVQIALGMLVASDYRNREADADYTLKQTEAFQRALSGEDYGSYA
jgi:hypothetical protein